jgi:hypothetical protein
VRPAALVPRGRLGRSSDRPIRARGAERRDARVRAARAGRNPAVFGPSGEVARARPFGSLRGAPVEVEDRSGRLTHFRSGNRQEHCRREKPRTGPGGEPQESWPSREGSAYWVVGEALERRSSALPESGRGKRRREGDGKPPPRRSRIALERRTKPKRVSARPRLRPGRVRILAGSKALELRGNVTSWSSEQEDALPETA